MLTKILHISKFSLAILKTLSLRSILVKKNENVVDLDLFCWVIVITEITHFSQILKIRWTFRTRSGTICPWLQTQQIDANDVVLSFAHWEKWSKIRIILSERIKSTSFVCPNTNAEVIYWRLHRISYRPYRGAHTSRTSNFEFGHRIWNHFVEKTVARGGSNENLMLIWVGRVLNPRPPNDCKN